MSAPIGPYEPFYDGGYKDLPDNTTPPKSEALNHWDDWLGTVVDAVDGIATGAVDTSGVPAGEVLTSTGPGLPAAFQVPTDVSAAAATAVAAYLAANPPGDWQVDKGYLSLPGDTSKPCAQCASSPNYGGDFELRFDDLTIGVLNPGTNQTLFSIQNSATQNMILRQNTSAKLALLVFASPGTGTATTATASVVTPAMTGSKLRVTWRQSDGRTVIWVPSTAAFKSTTGVTHVSPNQRTFDDPNASFGAQHVGMTITGVNPSGGGALFPDGTTITAINSATSVHTSANANNNANASGVTYTVGAVLTEGTKWANLGADQFANLAGAARFASTAMPMTVGAVGNGTSLISAGSKVGRVRYYSGIENPDGSGTITLLADPTFSGRRTSDFSFSDAEANLWAMQGNAKIVGITGTVTKNGTTATVETPALIQSASKKYRVVDYGDLATSDETRRAAVQSAIDVCYTRGGGVVELPVQQLVVGPNASLLNQITGQAYASILLKDGVTLEGCGPYAGGLMLAAGANCHMIGHPGRLQGGVQDHINNARIVGLLLDGNKANQDQCHDHDGLRLPQYPGLVVEDVMLQNIDGHGYYSTANGDFAASISDLGQNTNATVVKPLWLERVWSHDNARWGFMMSATNRKTHENELYAIQNGTTQARIVGKKPNPAISAGGNLVLTIDSSATLRTIALTAADTASTIVSKINAVLTTSATAALSTGSNRLMITSATTGGVSWVGVDNTSTTSVLLDLGLARQSDNGPLNTVPMHLNAENNAAVGANEYGGFYADHSEAGTDQWFAEGNYGDGLFIHNVNMAMFGGTESTNNNGYGATINELNTSKIREILAGMNCVDLGYASYRPRTIRNASNNPITTPKAEVLLLAGTVGYGVTANSVIETIIAPGIKSSLGAGSDNRHADCAVAIEHGVASTLVLGTQIYGPDGGLNADGLGATIRDYR